MQAGPRFFKLRGGETKYLPNFIRILPPHENMVHPETGKHTWYWPVAVHFNVGPPGAQRTIACLKKMEIGDCPVCQLSYRLRNAGNKDEADRLRPTWNSYANVVKLDDEGELVDELVYVMAIRPKVLRALDDEFEHAGDLTHMETGRNVLIRRLREDLHSEYKITVTDPCPFPGKEEILETRYDLTELVTFMSEGEVEALIEGRGTGDPFTEVDGDEETPRLKRGAIPVDGEEAEAIEGEYREVPEGEDEEEDPSPEIQEELAKIGAALPEAMAAGTPSEPDPTAKAPKAEPEEAPKKKRGGRPKKDAEADGGAAMKRLRKAVSNAE